jgi:levanase
MNNWEYASGTPTSPWRGAQSLPRQLTVKKIDGQWRLLQQPAHQLRGVRQDPVQVIRNRSLTATPTSLPITGTTLEIKAEIDLGTADKAGIILRSDDSGNGTKIGYDRATGQLYVDRTTSGNTTAGPTFPGIHTGPLTLTGNRVTFTLYLDTSSVEVFGGQGQTVITDQIFPNPANTQTKGYADGGTAKLITFKAWPLNP